MKKTLFALTAITVLSMPSQVFARDQILIVGSSTVYPFVTVAAEQFGNETGHKAPTVEPTGTGGGFKQFCEGIGEKFPDFANASRAIKDSERELCAANGVDAITELKIGFDGIVLANAKNAPRLNLTKEQIFLALAEKIPSGDTLIDNPNQTWNQIDPALPAEKIEVYGPPATSGTRDAFVELVMEPACKDLPAFKTAIPDEQARAKACHLVRTDGAYIEAGENDNVIISKLTNNPKALGVFGFSFLDQNRNTVQGSLIGGVEPTFENILGGTYGVSRSLYVYAKDAHIDLVDGMGEFAQELVSTDALGEYGYLADKGLIPLPADELAEMQKRAAALAAKSGSL